jgi:hypothetical protein
MRSYLNGLAVLIALMLTVSACDKKAATNDIAGSSSKTWKVEKLVNANGNREKLGRDQQDDKMQFYADGTFTANSSEEHGRGTWQYDAGKKALSLQFENANVTQNYEVVDLTSKKMRLRTGDGSEMLMEAME